MSDLKKIIRFLIPTMVRCFVLVAVIVLIGDMMQLYTSYEMNQKSDYFMEPLCFYDWHLWVVSLGLMLVGFLYSAREFYGFIRIRAQRKLYLVGSMGWMGLISIAMVLINRLICLGLTLLVNQIPYLPVEAFLNISLLKEWSFYISSLSIGWGLGACYYRFRKLGILAGIIILIIILSNLNNISMYRILYKTPDVVGKSIRLSIFCGIIGTIFLYSAPTKRYTRN